MPSLDEVYKRALEQGGDDSRSAKAIKLQIDCERYWNGRIFQQLFEEELESNLYVIVVEDK